MTNDPLVTIVVTPRERYAVVLANLDSLAANTPEPHRLVYVAPGAPDSVQSYLRDVCSARGYELILAPAYLSPNASRNLGLAEVKTKYVVFIENDVVVEPGWLGALLRCAEEEHADIVSPLCLIGDPAERNVHSLGGLLLVEQGGEAAVLREHQHCGPICLRTDPRQLTRIAADFSEFHCALVHRSVFERMGPLDERILGAAEHIDLALHLRALGCRGFAEPDAVVSYLPQAYTIADLETYRVRWSDAWHFPTMRHLGEKWNLSSDSPLFPDYVSSFREIRERCLLREEDAAARSPRQIDQLQPAQTIVQLLDQMRALGYPLEALVRVRDVYGIASEVSTGHFRASGRTFLAHLVGTASITASFGANAAVIGAALLHAAYAHGRFPSDFASSTAAMRRWLRRRVGGAIEKLIYSYSRLQLSDLTPYLNGDVGRMPIELANAVVIRIANGIEDRIGGDHNYFDSADWLERSNKQIHEWMPAFAATAEPLGMGAMAAILDDAAKRVESGNGHHALRPSRPLNYSISDNGVIEALNARNLLADDSSDAPLSPRPDQRMAATAGGNGSRFEQAPAGLQSDPSRGDTSGGNASQNDISRGNTSSDSAGPAPRVVSVDLKPMAPLNDGVVRHESERVRVVSDPRPWAYSAYLSLQNLDGATGQAEIQVRLHAQRGTIGLLLLERGSSVHPAAPEQSVSPSAKPVTVRFEIAAIQEVGDLVLRSWPSDDGSSEVVIDSVSVYLE